MTHNSQGNIYQIVHASHKLEIGLVTLK